MSWWIIGTEHLQNRQEHTDDADLDALYEGQLESVLDAYGTAATEDPADHACHGCALDPTIRRTPT